MISRRNFIKVSGLAGGGLMMSLSIPVIGETGIINSIKDSFTLNKFLTIEKNGNLIFHLTKHEMGQGTGTGIPMIFADELGADWSKVIIKNADYDQKFGWEEMGTTGGSGSIERIWDSIRKAGAMVRELLKQAAANHWGVEKDILIVKNSYVINPISNKKLEFGKLAEAASVLTVPENVLLKDIKDYVYIGKSIKNRITKEIIVGKGGFGIDMDLPEMVYATIKRCPVYKGKLKNYDDKEARNIDGVLEVFPIVFPKPIDTTQYVPEGVVVVANSTWNAFKGCKQLKVEWDYGENAGKSMTGFENEMTSAKDTGRLIVDIGAIESEFKNPENEILEAEYNNPHQAHALMEPLNATAHYKADSCEIWVGTQDGGIVNTEVAKVIQLPTDKVIVHVLNSGGSFGRRYHVDSSMEAAFISKKVNKPVKLTWTREDEIMFDHFHPYQRNYFKAVITPGKEALAFENKAVKSLEYVPGWADKWDQPYYFPNIRTYFQYVPNILPQGPWRSVGEHSSCLGKECFIDELAHKVLKDPVDYRIELLSKEVDMGDPSNFPDWVKQYILPDQKIVKDRLLKVMEYIKINGLWDKDMPEGRGKGFAIENFGQTVCAQIAEVNMEDPDHGFRVDKITAIVHCGMVINPHFGRGQIEGSIIWALSALKYGGLEVENGVVMRDNFHNNKVIRMDESPEIEVIFIDSSDKPSGLGEPGTPPLAPAVLNAIFNASGKRIRKLPVTRDDIKI